MEEEMRFLKLDANKRKSMWQCVALGTAVLMLFAFTGTPFAATVQQKTFQSAEEAVKAAVAAAKSNDDKELIAIFGAQAKNLISSGDPVADKQRREQFLAEYDERNRLATEGENTILVIG